MRSFILVIAFLLLLPVAASAQQQDTPDENLPALDEYNNVPPGLMMLESSSTPADASSQSTDESDVMTMDDIITAYNHGQYDVVYKHLVPIANGNYPLAEEMLGVMYRNGQGVPKDPITAVTWLTKAAEAGRPLAQHHLGTMAFMGEGGPPDIVRALMWLYIATAHYPEGPEKQQAQHDRDNVAAQLSRRDRERALALAREWLEKHDEAGLLDGVK